MFIISPLLFCFGFFFFCTSFLFSCSYFLFLILLLFCLSLALLLTGPRPPPPLGPFRSLVALDFPASPLHLLLPCRHTVCRLPSAFVAHHRVLPLRKQTFLLDLNLFRSIDHILSLSSACVQRPTRSCAVSCELFPSAERRSAHLAIRHSPETTPFGGDRNWRQSTAWTLVVLSCAV